MTPRTLFSSPTLPLLFFFAISDQWKSLWELKLSSFSLTLLCISVPGMLSWFVGHNCWIKQDGGCLANTAFHSEWEVPWLGNWIYPLLYIIDKAWLNINQTLLETGPEFNNTILAPTRNLGFMPLTASPGIMMPFSLRLVKSRRIDRGEEMKCVRPDLLGCEWGRPLISFDWNTASIYLSLACPFTKYQLGLIMCQEAF